jgi:Rps23 Pro-64 3,4-dihydroxylase Tpa1-like proline 4-hydroxylase
VLDDFLPQQAAETMLAQILAAEPAFTPSEIGRGATSRVNSDYRSSLRLPGRVGVDLTSLVDAIGARLDAVCTGAGVRTFPVAHHELSIVAHRDGDFYKPHIDTRTGATDGRSIRVVSCVYYLHRPQRGFSGGELAIHPIMGGGEPILIEPRHNRLAIFPSFIPHEVLPTRSSGSFADSRFSVNCWLHQARRPGPVTGDCA